MPGDELKEIIETLIQIEGDFSIPKNIRFKIKSAISALEDKEKNMGLKVNRSLQELDSLDEDSNLPSFTRTQIWNVVSSLERMV